MTDKEKTSETVQPPDMLKDCSYYCASCESFKSENKKLIAGLEEISQLTPHDNNGFIRNIKEAIYIAKRLLQEVE